MTTNSIKIALSVILTLLFTSFSGPVFAALVKGIYLTQTTMENTKYLKYLIANSKAVGITTFVVDMEIPSKRYQKNVALLKENGIRYVARVVVFPTGGHPEQISSPAYWAKRYALMKTAVDYGAQEIQLDYIRYNTKQHASADNAKHIFTVVQWFKDKLAPQGVPLQADVFGISSYGESKHIGQNLRMMAQSVDALCPMVYPSHFEPFRTHAVTPYQTIYNSLHALRSQFDNKMPVKLYAFIEISNYRYPLPGSKRRSYVVAEMKAVQDAGADGWYVWSAHNKYDYLFSLMAEINHSSKDASSNVIMTADAKPDTRSVEAETKAVTAEAKSNEDTTETKLIQATAHADQTITTAEATPDKKEKVGNDTPISVSENTSQQKSAVESWTRPISLH
ncbi:MAG: putative glycoside hydrolase [Gammaproteobacteria bacterium]|nr:putative glycoside hydrolase [Gammaproteobacteria bacterium]